MSIWFTTRGAGLSALILLSLSTCLGALVSRPAGKAIGAAQSAERRYVLQYLHRACAGLGVLVLGIHITTAVADSYAHVGLTGALIPFTSGYRPTWIALGSLAAYCLLGVSVLGMARGRMAGSERGARVWRRMHALAYAGWASAILHGFTSGTDSSLDWVRTIYLTCLLAVLGASGYRFVRHVSALPSLVEDVLGGPRATDRFADRRATVPSSPTGPVRMEVGP